MHLRRVIVVFAILAFAACGPSPTNGGFQITISGEGAATEGLRFPAASNDALFFQDGWDLTFSNVVVFIDGVRVSENPDKSPTDQLQTGVLVAEEKGPWVVDLAQPGPLDAKEGNGKAFALTTISAQRSGAAFDPTQRYAFGFDLGAATSGATKVNAVDDATISTMVTKGWSVWLNGTATFKGTSCRSTVVGYDFERMPKKVNFAFGFKAPVSFRNCVNPELMPAGTKGIQPQRNGVTTAQVTLHLDHPLWESLTEDAPLRFDLIAARKTTASGAGPAVASLSQDDLVGVDFIAGKDAQGTALPWRYCGAPAAADRTAGTVSYDTGGVPTNPAGGAAGLKDLYDYMTYNLSTLGHLNNDGLCFPSRNFPAPP